MEFIYTQMINLQITCETLLQNTEYNKQVNREDYINRLFSFETVPKPPKIDPKDIPEEVIVKKGEVIEIGIPFIGVPQPEGHWKKDGNPLSEANTDIRMSENLAQIIIPDAQRGDAGNYELTLTNEVGSEVIPVPVRVLGKNRMLIYHWITLKLF